MDSDNFALAPSSRKPSWTNQVSSASHDPSQALLLPQSLAICSFLRVLFSQWNSKGPAGDVLGQNQWATNWGRELGQFLERTSDREPSWHQVFWDCPYETGRAGLAHAHMPCLALGLAEACEHLASRWPCKWHPFQALLSFMVAAGHMWSWALEMWPVWARYVESVK